MKTRILVATTAAFALTGAAGASALVSTDATKLVTVGPGGGGGNGDTAGTGGKREKSDTRTFVCDSGDNQNRTIVMAGVVEAWPPNHKYRNVTFSAIDGDGDGTTTLTTTGSHDQMLADGSEMNGAGNTDPATDVMPPSATGSGDGSASTAHQFRGERSGRDKSGRTYEWTADATFDDGETCHADFTSVVPHDQGNRAGGGKSRSKKSLRRR